MKVIICGAGQDGWQIARHLSSEKNDVTVVDNNSELVSRAVDTLDVNGIAGNASYPDVLSMAGAADADMIAQIAKEFSDTPYGFFKCRIKVGKDLSDLRELKL